MARKKKPATKSKNGPQLDLLLELMAIAGKSGGERPVADFICRHLTRAGVPDSAIKMDAANKRAPISSDCGNLIVKLPGTKRKEPRRMLMAHMDTVPICVGSQPVRKGNFVRSADPKTGLGADDRAGVATVLCAALDIVQNDLPHPPLTFLWTIQEEIGLHGARLVSLASLGNPKLAFNWDGGAASKLTIGATGGYRMTIEVAGIASHAGNAPQKGVSAIAIASLAIADLQKNGWHGNIKKSRKLGTSNVGVIQGGNATNVVTDFVSLRVEARSHDPDFRVQIVREIEKAFKNAANTVKNDEGQQGSVKFEGQLDYESFRLSESDPAVVAASDAVKALGREPILAITNGGVDANWLSARGLPTVTLGCGQLNPHMTNEALDVREFQDACKISRRLAMDESD